MTLSNGNYLFTKDENESLSDHFGTKEFACKCSYDTCVDQIICKDLVDKLESLRIDIGQPITITSGYRCDRHQADLIGTPGIETVPKSTHQLGQAADLKCPIPSDDLENAGAKYFMAIGVGKSFCHMDLRIGKVRRWTYSY
jgi:zinc D-Ala-D-Ala carboxypeptidase